MVGQAASPVNAPLQGGREGFLFGKLAAMTVHILADAAAVGSAAADLVQALLAANRRAVLGLAAGTTPAGLYRELGRRRIDLSAATVFSLDEYLGLPAGHPAAFARFFQDHLFTALRPRHIHLVDGNPRDVEASCAAYEAKIRAAGGIDLQILGIGGNGHIAFNEPGSSLGGRTRAVRLSAATRAANQGAFPDGEAVPERAVTMGIGTILEARRILLLAFGAGKAQAVARALEGPVTAMVPASALQLHPAVTVLLDAAAARDLTLRDEG
jgi:glucosamine-6-phosphate deaminase